jgi:Tfp pilus assembly protein FimV
VLQLLSAAVPSPVLPTRMVKLLERGEPSKPPTCTNPPPGPTIADSLPCTATRRAEVELRQRLAQRDQRISELKEELEARSRFSEDLRRRLSSSGAGPSGRRDTTPPRAAAPVARSLSAPPGEDLRGGLPDGGARSRGATVH